MSVCVRVNEFQICKLTPLQVLVCELAVSVSHLLCHVFVFVVCAVRWGDLSVLCWRQQMNITNVNQQALNEENMIKREKRKSESG